MDRNKYDAVTNDLNSTINLLRELKSFRNDEKYSKYRRINSSLIFRISAYRFKIRRLREKRNLIRKGTFIDVQFIKDTSTVRGQFDSCSYAELTGCVFGRISRIRECRRFILEEAQFSYPTVQNFVCSSLKSNENEIKLLLKMRRILKRSGMRNWDSSRLKVS